MPPTSPRWIPHKQHQGVTIYRYAGPPSGALPHGLSGEYMTCAPVRGSPGAVLQVLMSGTCTATVLGPAVETEVLSNCMQPDGSLKQVRVCLCFLVGVWGQEPGDVSAWGQPEDAACNLRRVGIRKCVPGGL